MSDSDSGEKSEEPTDERLRKLREDGNVPKSQDVTSSIKFLVVFLVIASQMSAFTKILLDYTRVCIDMSQRLHTFTMTVATSMILLEGIIAMMLICLPVFGAEYLAAIILNVAQIGFLFSTKPITPDFNRLNPVTGFKNLFNMKKMVEILKTIIKFVTIAYVSYITVKKYLRDIALIIRADLFTGVKITGSIIWDIVIKTSMVFIIIAAADFFYQRKRYIKDNMMSKHDIKQEYKQSEGDPQQKADRKRLHQEIISNSGGGGKGLMGSNVVVRNPDHIAVALKYDAQEHRAPLLVAKGERLWAKKILAEAEKLGIPIVHNVPLARALNQVTVGDEIPEILYQAVAEVLTFVYTLNTKYEAQKAQRAKKA
jgi:flagellar biosynthetic protein FlhB